MPAARRSKLGFTIQHVATATRIRAEHLKALESDEFEIGAVVDGTPQCADSGQTLTAGSVVYFTGVDVKITSGKAAATFITIDGRSLEPLGSAVTTRELSSQTSF